jgi:hypothetical protein
MKLNKIIPNGKRGSVLFAIIVTITIFMFGMLVINFVKDDVDLARDSTNLDCGNLSISDGAKVACLGADVTIPYLFLLVLSAIGGFLASKFLI